jgi:hypothetical protein
MPKSLVLSNLEEGDISFEHDLGVWNITRAVADCKAGKHRQYRFDVAEVLAGNAAVEVDRDKVERYARIPGLASFALIFVVEDGKVWLIDGIHHLRAMSQRGLKDCAGYVIEEHDTARYRVLFNGERQPPWK